MKIVLAFLAIAFFVVGYFLMGGTVSVANEGEYKISKITYTYASADASQIVAVDFDVYPPIAQISVSLTGEYTPCEMFASYTHAHCHVNVPVSAVKELRIR